MKDTLLRFIFVLALAGSALLPIAYGAHAQNYDGGSGGSGGSSGGGDGGGK